MGVKSTGTHSTTTKADGHLLEYYRQNFSGGGAGRNVPPPPPPQGMSATGGIINDYTVGATVYRAHIFNSSGTLEVESLSTDSSLPSSVEIFSEKLNGVNASS